jgi:hypothetical protein
MAFALKGVAYITGAASGEFIAVSPCLDSIALDWHM